MDWLWVENDYNDLPWHKSHPVTAAEAIRSDDQLEQNSATYKILNGCLLKVFSSDSEAEDNDQAKVTQRKGRVFVPCFVDESKMKYFKTTSCLTVEQQETYIQLWQKYGKQNAQLPLPEDEKKLKQLQALEYRVSEERKKFKDFIRQYVDRDRHLFLHADVKTYIEEVWKHRLQNVKDYPEHYESLMQIPLVYSDTNIPVMTLEKNLLELGAIPVEVIPDYMHSSKCILSQYWKLYENFPPDDRGPDSKACSAHKTRVSSDPIAEKLAVENGADIVISVNALKCIADNHSKYQKCWDIPLVVRNVTDEETGKSKTVVFVDKPLPPRNLTTVEKNYWFYKFAIRTFLYQLETKQFNKESGSDCTSMKDLNPFTTDSGNSDAKNLKRKSDVIQSDESDSNVTSSVRCQKRKSDIQSDNSETNVISPLKDQKGNSDNFQNGESGPNVKSHVTCQKRKSISESEDSKSDVESPVKKKTSSDIQSDDSKIHIPSPVSNLKKKSNSDESDETDNDHLVIDTEDELDSSEISKPVLIQRNEESNSVSDVKKDRLVDGITSINLSSEQSTIESTPKPEVCTMEQPTSMEATAACNSDTNFVNGSIQEMDGKGVSAPRENNVCYRLWKLKKEDDFRKRKFMKGNDMDREINLIVRCKVDGCQKEPFQTYYVVPKLEYQCEYGAEQCSLSELTQQWLSLYLRPNTILTRVRLNIRTSEIMMVEHRTLQELSQEYTCIASRSAKTILGSIYNVLVGLVDLRPGSYLLTHNARLGAFANLLRHEGSGRYNLHSMFLIDPSKPPEEDTFETNPIDFSVPTPYHLAYNRVPGTFPPKTKSNKSKNKKKKKKNKGKKKGGSKPGGK